MIPQLVFEPKLIKSVSQHELFFSRRESYSVFCVLTQLDSTCISTDAWVCVCRNRAFITVWQQAAIITEFARSPARPQADYTLCPTAGRGVCVCFVYVPFHPCAEPHHMWSALKHFCVLRGCIAFPCWLKSLSPVVSLSVTLWDGFLYSVSTLRDRKSLHHTQHRLVKLWIHSNTRCLIHQPLTPTRTTTQNKNKGQKK